MTLRRRVLLGAVSMTTACWLTAAPLGNIAAATVPPAGSETGAIDDSASTRRVQMIVAALAAAGLGVAGVTVWFWRSTKPDPEALGPLDVMSGSRWRRQDPDNRSRTLAAVRPGDEQPSPPREAVDLAALAASRDLPALDDHAGFGDLVDARLPSDDDPSREVSSELSIADDKPVAVETPNFFSASAPAGSTPSHFLPPLPPPKPPQS